MGGTINSSFIINSSTQATSTNTGALQVVNGGVGIGGNLFVGGSAYLTGDLYIDGTQTVVNSTTISTGDKTITLSTASTNASLAANSGIAVGPTGSPYANFLYDGTANWTVGGSAASGLKSANHYATSYASVGSYTSSQKGEIFTVNGGAYVNGTLTATNIFVNGYAVSTATGVTVQATNGNSNYYPVFVNVNTSTPTPLSEYTTSSFVINPSTGNTTFGGAVAIGGGVPGYWGGVLNVSGGATLTGITTASNMVIGYSPTVTGAALTVIGGNYVSGITTSTNTTNATSTSTGALQIAGGVGIGQDVWVGGIFTLTNFVPATAYGEGTLKVRGGASFGHNIYSAGTVNGGKLKATTGGDPTSPAISMSTGVDGFCYSVLSGYANGIDVVNFSQSTARFIPGQVQILTTATTNSTSTGALIVAGGIGVSGDIYVGGTVTATDLNSLSDQNLKDNVVTIEDPMLVVNQLRGVGFDWKDSGEHSYGVIAQELEQILPELVHQDSSGQKNVSYIPLLAFLIEAVKKQGAQIEDLYNQLKK